MKYDERDERCFANSGPHQVDCLSHWFLPGRRAPGGEDNLGLGEHRDQPPVEESRGEVGRGCDSSGAEELSYLVISGLLSRYREPEVHVLLGPEESIEAVVTSAPQ